MTVANLSHPNICDGWFRETTTLWPGQALSLQVKEILHVEKSKFQDVLVFKSTTYGNVLVLDGVVQCTERDEFAYQEMMAHLPLFAHPKPKRVLVVGGGDGGVLREIVKHESVESVTICEIDECVIRVSKQHLPDMAVGFAHPKVTVNVGDGLAFMREAIGTGDVEAKGWDVIITDSSDPVGPAEGLFGQEYFQLMKKALRKGGIICTQGECMWLHLPLIKQVLTTTRDIFPSVTYAYTTIPTYPSGQIGFVLACNEAKDLSVPVRSLSRAEEAKAFRYYNAQIHQAAFVMPTWVRNELESKKA